MPKMKLEFPTTIGEDVDYSLLGDEDEGDEDEGHAGDENEGEEDEGTTDDEAGGDDEGDEGETEWERRLRAQDEQLQAALRTIDSLVQTRGASGATAAAEAAAPDIDFSDLPDPVDKPAEFKKALAERVSGALATSRRETQQQTQSEKINQIWEVFKDENPDLAPKEMLASSAAAAEMAAARARGLDSVQWAIDNPAEFRKKVAERMRTELGIAAPKRESGKKPTTANRTGGVGAGTKGAASASGKKPEKPAGFLDQLKKKQLESGLI